jgi:hypothetical protein
MRSEQVCWVITVTVDQMDKFTPLVSKLVTAESRTVPRLRSRIPSAMPPPG